MKSGFTLIEVLISLAIVGLLATITFVYLVPTRSQARDAKRKADVAFLGRYLSLSCPLPQAGAGDYDLAEVAADLVARYPQYQSFLANLPYDPKVGRPDQTFYRYVVNNNNRCALYANLENKQEAVTLPDLSAPTPGGGRGVWRSAGDGWNGTPLYFQFSN